MAILGEMYYAEVKRNLIYIAMFLIIAVTGFYVYGRSDKVVSVGHQKCPDDFGTDDAGSADYLAATNKWTNDFYDTHPGASLGDWARARYDFLVENNCTLALQRIEDARRGKADPVAMETIQKAITETVRTAGR